MSFTKVAPTQQNDSPQLQITFDTSNRCKILSCNREAISINPLRCMFHFNWCSSCNTNHDMNNDGSEICWRCKESEKKRIEAEAGQKLEEEKKLECIREICAEEIRKINSTVPIAPPRNAGFEDNDEQPDDQMKQHLPVCELNGCDQKSIFSSNPLRCKGNYQWCHMCVWKCKVKNEYKV